MHNAVSARTALLVAASALSLSALAQAPKSGNPQIGQLGKWTYQVIKPYDFQGELTATLNTTSGQADLYIRRAGVPTLTTYDYRVTGNAATKTVRITNASTPALTSDNWYVAAYQKGPATFTLSKSVKSIPAQFSGNGATPFAKGTTFRTWAPFATSAYISGQFNNWSGTAALMQSEGNGWWSLDYRNANPGQQYKFVLKNGSTTSWKNDPWAKQLTNSTGNSVIFDQKAYTWQTNNFQTPSWNDLVIYEMHVGAFNDSVGGGPGTLTTALAKLDYLQSVGINCVELLPVQEFPGDFSWGYNNSYPYTVESAYGGPAALKKFVDEANKRGIAVLLDLVHNHYGPNDMDLWRYDGWYQGTWGGVFFYNDDRAITSWGYTRPDFGRSEVRQYIHDNQMMWAQDFRVSGFRWDSCLTMRTTNWGDNPDGWSLLQWLNNDLDATQPWKINIAEDMQNNEWLTKPTAVGGAGFDSQWSNYVHTIRGVLTQADDNNRSMWAVRSALVEAYNGDPMQRVIYTESHDEDANGHQRLPAEIDSSNPASYWAQKRSTLGAAITLTAPGIPMLFMGQEFLEDGYFADSDPLDWSKVTTFSGINALYKDLIGLRRNLGGKTQGLRGRNINVSHLNDTNKVIAYHRWDNGGSGDDVVVVANFKNATWSNYRVGLPRSGSWSVVFNSDWNGYSSLFGNLYSPNVTAGAPAYDGLGYSATVNLAPYSVVILAKD
ncbi:MAG: alpha amylase C-terminal domain-containing protein [Armatimonadetes bacterium]|nr:alpha amylase C-terminal domain-containing protein [Armatimonadota bacterium]